DLFAASSRAAASRPTTVTAGICQSQSTPAWTRQAAYAPSAAGTNGRLRARIAAVRGSTSVDANPGGPCDSLGPCDPAGPVGPAGPAGPCAPAGPAGPGGPCRPAGSRP